MSSSCKLFIKELDQLSSLLNKNNEDLITLIKENFMKIQDQFYKKYCSIFISLKKFIQELDITLSNVICSRKYNYCKPIIDPISVNSSTSDSYLIVKDLRHPIIEQFSQTEYITNDISLTNEQNGLLLYGLNSSGKSSLLRSVGTLVIIAQAGLYVPCSYLKYRPFHTVISQVDLTDDLFNGKSSFITEMVGLKRILQCSGPNTLVLSDELCKGTENYSSISLVTSTLTTLLDNGSKFFFTTHLHDIPDIISSDKLKIGHLSIDTKGSDIIFNRKIKEGSGHSLYGLEVASSILENKDLIDNAFLIRNKITNNNTKIVSSKRSHYNTSKILTKCEICSDTKNLETHHINFQMNADKETGIIKNKYFHKNNIFNLVCLCHDCHSKVTSGSLIVNGYKTSLNGTFLDHYEHSDHS